MIDINIVLLLLFTHWFADFILQSDYVAQNKSKSNLVLFHHVYLYMLPFVALGFLIPITLGWVLLNFILHYTIDFVTSRINARLWEKKQVHWFFVCVGFDQFLHYASLLLTYYILIIETGIL